MTRIAMASDHAGYRLKEVLVAHLRSKGYAIDDFGTDSESPVDYPDYIRPAAMSVAAGKNEYGIVLGGSGNGEAMTANKVRGVRCALCWDAETARLAKAHNNANMISMGARLVSPHAAVAMVDTWLKTEFEHGRHVRRLEKLEPGYGPDGMGTPISAEPAAKAVKFAKYHGLGNDYLVIEPGEIGAVDRERVRRICHRNYGIGSDGILLGPLPSTIADFGLKIFNPDGSEAEKSGNGLRIFARRLWDRGLVQNNPFTVETLGGTVVCRVHAGGAAVTVEMGRVSFLSTDIPVTGERREVLRERMTIGGIDLDYCAATVGNPHCVVLCEAVSADMARKYGPLIETAPYFPNRTNVQFMQVIDRGNIRIEIWERGAGYTLASGSSSTAAAAVAHRLGLCDDAIMVTMPGGDLTIHLSADFSAVMTGPVTRIGEGVIDPEMFTNDDVL